MKSSDLRIGNYVHHNINNSKKHFIGNELIVCEITENSITTFYNNIDGHKQIVRGKSNYEPIPLTEEWLLRMGFEKDIDDLVLELKHILFISYNDDEFVHVKNMALDTITSCQYVHQLQNLFWCLTGKELTINDPVSI